MEKQFWINADGILYQFSTEADREKYLEKEKFKSYAIFETKITQKMEEMTKHKIIKKETINH